MVMIQRNSYDLPLRRRKSNLGVVLKWRRGFSLAPRWTSQVGAGKEKKSKFASTNNANDALGNKAMNEIVLSLTRFCIEQTKLSAPSRVSTQTVQSSFFVVQPQLRSDQRDEIESKALRGYAALVCSKRTLASIPNANCGSQCALSLYFRRTDTKISRESRLFFAKCAWACFELPAFFIHCSCAC